ncbi:MAG: hypothetical protein H0T80_06575 [Betaproteobacteria bacterium]|nr:hypothetical protein [Betaproteobacteria bacterium]
MSQCNLLIMLFPAVCYYYDCPYLAWSVLGSAATALILYPVLTLVQELKFLEMLRWH